MIRPLGGCQTAGAVFADEGGEDGIPPQEKTTRARVISRCHDRRSYNRGVGKRGHATFRDRPIEGGVFPLPY
jgi:hypothetical protein